MSKFAVTFESFEIAPDASGVVGVLRSGGYRFAFSWLGTAARVANMAQSGSTRGAHAAARRAEHAVQSRVNSETTAEWRAACAAMYA